MAKSPFQNSPNIAPIAPVQQQGGFTPIAGAENIVAAGAQALSAVGTVVKDNFQRELKEDVKQSTQSLELALTARAFPKFAKQLLSEHAKDDPVVKGAMQQMIEINNAFDKGLLPHQYALQRLSVVKRNAIEAAPEFASEITAAIQDVSGRDPDKAFFAELLQPASQALTPEEEGRRKAEIEISKTMTLTGATREEVIGLGRLRQMADIEESNLKTLTAKGQRLGITLNKRVELAIPQFNNMIIENVLQQVQAGGVIDPASMSLTANSLYDAKRAELLADLPAGVDAKVIAPALDNLERMRSRTTAAIEDGSMLNLITKNKDILLKGTQLGVMQQNPQFLLAAALNPSDLTRGLTFLEKAQGTAFGKKVAGELSLGAKVFFESEGASEQFLNYYNNTITQGQYGNPNPPVTQLEKTAHAMAGVQAAKSKDPVIAAKALEGLLATHGEDFAWAALDDHEIFLGVDAKVMGQTVENLQIAQTAGLVLQFNQLATHPQFEESRLRLTGNTLTYEGELSAATGIGGALGFATNVAVLTVEGLLPDIAAQPIRRSFTGLSKFLDEYNRAARISKKYVDAGKINAALFTSPQKYMSDVTTAGLAGKEAREEQQVQQQPTTKVLVWEDDAAGVPRLVEQ